MSKILSRELMTVYLDMKDDHMNHSLSDEAEEVYRNFLLIDNKIAYRLNKLAEREDSLNDAERAELEELTDTEKEFIQLKVERMTVEEMDRIIANLSAVEEELPRYAILQLQALREARKSTQK